MEFQHEKKKGNNNTRIEKRLQNAFAIIGPEIIRKT